MAPAKQAKREKPTKLNQKPSKKLSLFSSSEFVIVFLSVSESGIDSFDILYTDSKKTHEINREYRNKDYPADIITFAIFADSDDRFVFDGEINLGEVIIALDKVIKEAQKKGTSKEHELAFLISHGILHLLGFDHQTEADYNFVVELQNRALEYVKI